MSTSLFVGASAAIEDLVPKDDEALCHWTQRLLGFEIAYRPTCEEHAAPFQFLADAFFQRFSSAALRAARGAGKTRNCSILHLLNGHFRPGYETAHVGAVLRQANLNYSYVKGYFRDPLFARELARDPTMTETVWRHGSRLQVLPGTLSGVSGPHPVLATADEFDLMPWEVYQQFVGMAQSTSRYPAMSLFTSAQVTSFGPMARLIEESESRGLKVFTTCVFDSMSPCPTCEDAENVKRSAVACSKTEPPPIRRL